MIEFEPNTNINTGPIVACENSVEHYKKEIAKAELELQRYERQVQETREYLVTYREMLRQWLHAARLLKAEAGRGADERD